MDKDDFTPRNLTKGAVTTAISMKVAQLTKNVISDYTQFENDSIPVKLGTHMVGGIVANKLKPHTDKMVDKTADFINAKRANRAAKKNTPEEK